MVTKDLGQHWLRQWLVAWWHQVITWTNVDLSSVEFCGIHLTTILLVALINVSNHEMSSKIIFLKLQPHLPGPDELISPWLTTPYIHAFIFFRCVLRFPSTNIKIVFQAMVDTVNTPLRLPSPPKRTKPMPALKINIPENQDPPPFSSPCPSPTGTIR